LSKGNSPAFPSKDAKGQIWTGMNLRDYFALEAMNGLIKRLDLDKATNSHLAFLAYNIADYMLEERAKYK
jgi:hypothetical protein